jgi:hypothetical protein
MVGKRTKKILIITAVVFFSLILIIVITISPIAKRLVEKYDQKYTGRQIEIGWLYINPLTGYTHIRDLRIYEKDNKHVFFSAKGITVNVAVLKLLSKNYVIQKVVLNAPRARIIQNVDKFNFSDILDKFSEPKDTAKEETLRLSYKNLQIKNGEFHYIDKQIPINYFIKNVNFESKGKTWDVDTLSGKYSFLSGPGSGSIKGNFTFNFKSTDYSAAVQVDTFDLKIAEQYMQDIANFGKLRATLDANLRTSGNLNDSMRMASKGRIAINNLHFGKDENEDYFSFEKLVVNIREINMVKGIRDFDTVMIVRPEFTYERYDKLDNIQRMFGEKGANIDSAKADPSKFNLLLELADYMKMLSSTFKQDYFRVNKFIVQEANIQFTDYSLTEKFSMAFNPLTITADTIDKNNESIVIRANSKIQPYGSISATLSVNPKNTEYFDLNYQLKDIPASMFNPYLITYTSYPLDRGTIEFHGDWHVNNSVINSENHFVVLDPRVSEKVRKKDSKWIPMPLIMSFVRERGNVIDYKIPVKGNLKDPNFKIRDVITDLLKNIFVKPPSTPYIFDVRNTEDEVEKSLSIKWVMRTSKLLPNQEEFIEKMAEYLEENAEATITVNPMLYAEKEKEHILLFEAKKKYYAGKNNLDPNRIEEDDSLKIEKMSTKDSSFVRYLDAYVKDSTLFTIQEKCRVYLGEKFLINKFESLISKRKETFLSYFKENKTDDRIKIATADRTVPYNGFSFYKISYEGDMPDDLLEAYNKMEEFDNKNPRKIYKQWRD